MCDMKRRKEIKFYKVEGYVTAESEKQKNYRPSGNATAYIPPVAIGYSKRRFNKDGRN